MLWTRDGQLHLFHGRLDGYAVALCPVMAPPLELEEPGGEDQPRCAECIAEYGIGCRTGGVDIVY